MFSRLELILVNWDAVNGITGLVSAVCAVIGLVIQSRAHSEEITSGGGGSLLPRRYLASFLLVSSGWALCSLCFLLVFEPFGSYVSDRDYIKFYGIVLSVPAFLILRCGISMAERDNGTSGRDST
jgi:hypothetical protein